MADRSVVEALTREMAQLISKKVAGADFASAVDVYVKHFASTPDEVLADAVTRWQETVENPHSLPAVRVLRAYMGRAVPVDDRDGGRTWVAPRPEFVQAHVAFQEEARRIWARRQTPHTHRADRCRECEQSDAALQQLAVMLAELPAPLEGGTRPCRCDGSGWVDTAASWAAVTAQDVDTVREVFPCPVCRPEQFHAWQDGTVAV